MIEKICQIILSGDLPLAQKLIESQGVNVTEIKKYFYDKTTKITILDMVKPKATINTFYKKIKKLFQKQSMIFYQKMASILGDNIINFEFRAVSHNSISFKLFYDKKTGLYPKIMFYLYNPQSPQCVKETRELQTALEQCLPKEDYNLFREYVSFCRLYNSLGFLL